MRPNRARERHAVPGPGSRAVPGGRARPVPLRSSFAGGEPQDAAVLLRALRSHGLLKCARSCVYALVNGRLMIPFIRSFVNICCLINNNNYWSVVSL